MGWGGWANDVKTSMVIRLNAGQWWWLVASWCCVDWCWPALSYVALPCGTYCVNIAIAINPLVLQRPEQWRALWCARKGQGRSSWDRVNYRPILRFAFKSLYLGLVFLTASPTSMFFCFLCLLIFLLPIVWSPMGGGHFFKYLQSDCKA